jgi:hypothetical protein
MSKASKATNPIITAVRRSRIGNPKIAVMIDVPGFPQLSGEQLKQSVRIMVGQESIDEVGIIMWLLLLKGDREAAKKMISDALKEADHIFRRSLSRRCGVPPQDLMKQALQCIYENHGKLFKNGLKREVEERFYRGKLIPRTQWNRARKQIGWLTNKEVKAKGGRILRDAKRTLKRLEKRPQE